MPDWKALFWFFGGFFGGFFFLNKNTLITVSGNVYAVIL